MSEKDIIIKDKTLSSGLANDRENYSFVCKKLEKLAAAIYKVTDFVPDSEPLKWSLRKRATDVLCDVSVGESTGITQRSRALNNSLGEISGIVSLCEIAKEANVVSNMNFTILKDEFVSVRNLILENNGQREVAGSLIKDNKVSQQRIINKGQIKDTKDEEMSDNVPEKVVSAPVKIKASVDAGAFVPAKVSSNKNPVRALNINSRREKILNFVRENGAASIKDIAGIIIGCGEKTVQRELAKLVKEGVLKRSGERRWSRYSLA